MRRSPSLNTNATNGASCMSVSNRFARSMERRDTGETVSVVATPSCYANSRVTAVGLLLLFQEPGAVLRDRDVPVLSGGLGGEEGGDCCGHVLVVHVDQSVLRLAHPGPVVTDEGDDLVLRRALEQGVERCALLGVVPLDALPQDDVQLLLDVFLVHLRERRAGVPREGGDRAPVALDRAVEVCA